MQLDLTTVLAAYQSSTKFWPQHAYAALFRLNELDPLIQTKLSGFDVTKNYADPNFSLELSLDWQQALTLSLLFSNFGFNDIKTASQVQAAKKTKIFVDKLQANKLLHAIGAAIYFLKHIPMLTKVNNNLIYENLNYLEKIKNKILKEAFAKENSFLARNSHAHDNWILEKISAEPTELAYSTNVIATGSIFNQQLNVGNATLVNLDASQMLIDNLFTPPAFSFIEQKQNYFTLLKNTENIQDPLVRDMDDVVIASYFKFIQKFNPIEDNIIDYYFIGCCPNNDTGCMHYADKLEDAARQIYPNAMSAVLHYQYDPTDQNKPSAITHKKNSNNQTPSTLLLIGCIYADADFIIANLSLHGINTGKTKRLLILVPPHLVKNELELEFKQEILQEIFSKNSELSHLQLKLLLSSVTMHSRDVGMPLAVFPSNPTSLLKNPISSEKVGIIYLRHFPAADFWNSTLDPTFEKFFSDYFSVISKQATNPQCLVVLNYSYEQQEQKIKTMLLEKAALYQITLNFSVRLPREEFIAVLSQVKQNKGILATDGIQTTLSGIQCELPTMLYVSDTSSFNRNLFPYLIEKITENEKAIAKALLCDNGEGVNKYAYEQYLQATGSMLHYLQKNSRHFFDTFKSLLEQPRLAPGLPQPQTLDYKN